MKYLPHNAVCAEFGVAAGGFSKEILRRLSPKKLYLVDPYWKEYGDHYSWNRKSIMATWNHAVKRVRQYDTNKVVAMVVDYDYNFLADLPDNFFDWIYLDSTHNYEDTLRELDLMACKVKDEGMLAGHDWLPNPNNKHHGVYKAINEWLVLNPYYLYYLDHKTQWILKKITS